MLAAKRSQYLVLEVLEQVLVLLHLAAGLFRVPEALHLELVREALAGVEHVEPLLDELQGGRDLVG